MSDVKVRDGDKPVKWIRKRWWPTLKWTPGRRRIPAIIPKGMSNKGLLLGAIACIALFPLASPAQVPGTVFQRVLYVRVGAGTPHEGTATAFTLDVDGRQYTITAKHVVANLKKEDSLDIYRGDKWVPVKFKIFTCDDPVDIAVLVAPELLTPTPILEPDPKMFFYGQDVYFVGFPYGISMAAPKAIGDRPFPFIKRAAISSSVEIDAEKHVTQLLLDGYNNPGFSGGPVVYRDLNVRTDVFKVAGVVSGFIPELVPVVSPKPLKSPDEASEVGKAQKWRLRQRLDKSWVEMKDTDTYVPLNTGIVQAYSITPALDVIRQHPVGPAIGK